jgi:hypothetical protein
MREFAWSDDESAAGGVLRSFPIPSMAAIHPLACQTTAEFSGFGQIIPSEKSCCPDNSIESPKFQKLRLEYQHGAAA